jgi:molybdate transport repressor ModE-like protein
MRLSPDLEVRHCRVLATVHEAGGVVAASRALGLAQSTVSEALLSLERVLGAPVILRRPGREAVLTPAALALLPHAQALIAASEAAMAAVARQGSGLIRLGTVESISSFLLPRPLAAFRQRWPRADVQVAIGLCEDLRARVRRNDLDAAISIEGARGASAAGEGRTRVLAPAQLRLVVAPGHPLALAKARRAELAAQSFLFADADGAFNGLLADWLGAPRARARFASAGSIDGVKRGVADSEAIGVLPAYALGGDGAQRLAQLSVEEPLPAIALLLTTAKPPSGPLANLIDEVELALNAA